jgi:surface protein
MKIYLIASRGKINAPSDVTATTISSTQIEVSWTDNNPLVETIMEIYRSTDGVNFSYYSATSTGTTTYNDSALNEGVEYFYKIRSVKGSASSDFSNVASATTAISAPSSLTATTVSATRIDLAWTDNSTVEDGFKIERSTDNVSFTEIATVGAGITSFQNTGLTASTQYYYRVRAYKGSLNSDYSNTANATTSALAVERIIEIDTTKTETGSTASNQFRLAVSGATNINIDWGDSTTDTGVTGNITHTYAVAGVYDVKITGIISHSVANSTSNDKLKYMNIKQWGASVSDNSFNQAFFGCRNMVITAPDAPFYTGNSISMANCFYSCRALTNTDFSGWNTSKVTSFSFCFYDCIAFNGNVSTWDTSSCTTMSNMFSFCYNFNEDISSWNVSKVTNMSNMFNSCSTFNQDIGSWDVSKVTNFSNMFRSATVFNQDIGSWDVSSATDISAIFDTAKAFNQDLSSWNVGKVSNFSNTFDDADGMASNTSIESWNVGAFLTGGQAITFNSFMEAVNYTGDLTSYNMIRCTSMLYALRSGQSNFNYGLWDIRNVSSATLFMGNASPSTLSASNLASMYIAWAQLPVVSMSISFGTAKYDASGASARAILTAPRAVSVTGATDPNANGTYTRISASRYDNPNGWYFSYVSNQWNLYNPSNVSRAVSSGSFPLQNNANPMSGQGWTGAESGIALTLVGAGWTITDGGQL